MALWGAAFKAGTDDVRDSPALDVAARLRELGAMVTVYDPLAVDNARAIHPELEYVPHPVGVAAGADVLVIATGCDEFRKIDPESVGAVVASRTAIDAAQVVDVGEWERAGWAVRVLGQG